MSQHFASIGAILGGLAVATGAFGAHGLKDRLDARALEIWSTAAHYHLVHAVALLVVGILAQRAAGTALTVAGWSLLVGVVIFSGSLYTLALTGVGWLGAITPIGGTAFIIGWGALAVALWPSGT